MGFTPYCRAPLAKTMIDRCSHGEKIDHDQENGLGLRPVRPRMDPEIGDAPRDLSQSQMQESLLE